MSISQGEVPVSGPYSVASTLGPMEQYRMVAGGATGIHDGDGTGSVIGSSIFRQGAGR